MSDSPRTSLPEIAPVSPVPDSVVSETEIEAVDVSHLPEEHRAPLRRLHQRVRQAAEVIEQLRAENERLRRHIRELKARPVLPDAETVLTLDEDPDTVRRRITDFIDAIDTYLEATEPDGNGEEDESD